MPRVELTLFKLRIWDTHVHAVPGTDENGAPFDGPGTDLRGADAKDAFAAAKPMLAVLREVEPGIHVRSLSMVLARERVLVTLHPAAAEADARPRVIRVDAGPLYDRLRAAAEPVVALLARRCEQALIRRKEAP